MQPEKYRNPNFSGVTQDASYATGVPNLPTPNLPQSITSANLTQQSSFTPPTLQQAQLPTGNPNAMIQANAGFLNPTAVPQLAPNPQTSELYQRVKGSSDQLQQQQQQAQQQLNTDNVAVKAAQDKYNVIEAQLRGLSSQTQADQLSLEGQGRGIDQNILSRQSQEIARQNAIKAAPLQYQALLAQADIAQAQGRAELSQGILQQAQSQLDDLFKYQVQDAQNQYQYQTDLYKTMTQYMDKEQQRILDQKQFEAQQNFQLQRDQLQNDYAIQLENLQTKNALLIKNAVAPTQSGTTTQENEQALVVNDIGTVLDSPAFNTTFGLQGYVRRLIPTSPEYALQTNVNQIISQLSLAARGQLKGQGAVSDFEGKLLRDAQAALRFGLSPEQARKELVQVRGAIQTSSGGKANIVAKDPKTGQTQDAFAGQEAINQMIKEGLIIEYK